MNYDKGVVLFAKSSAGDESYLGLAVLYSPAFALFPSNMFILALLIYNGNWRDGFKEWGERGLRGVAEKEMDPALPFWQTG